MSSLIMLSDHRAYHLYRKETDMRKGFNLLCGIVLNELGRQVTQGAARYGSFLDHFGFQSDWSRIVHWKLERY